MALLTVLLLVAVMSALAVGVLDDIRFALRRAGNARDVGQAQWYAIGAEELARAQIRRLAARDPTRTTLVGDWNGRPFVFPIEGGVIRARVVDGGNCFNLNSVMFNEGGPRYGIAQFEALLGALDFPEADARRLTAALTDWIDRDQYGAEDDAYARRPQPYRTADDLLAEVSELRAIEGFTLQVYARLRPHVCALPSNALSPINLNTLGVHQAVLLTMVTEGRLRPEAARLWLSRRPEGGWPDAGALWLLPDLVDAPPVPQVDAQVGLRTRFFALETQVDYNGADVEMSALFEQEAQAVRLAARRWTRDE